MAFLDLFFTKGGRGGRPNAFKYLRPVTLIIVIVIIVFIDKGDCNSDDDNCDDCDDCDDCTDGSDTRAKMREGCLITGGAKEIYARVHLAKKRIIISFSNVWQIFFATLPLDAWSASLHTLRKYTKQHPKLSDSFSNPRALSSKIEFRTTQFTSTSSTGKRT